jgi:3-hydroxyacyl-CoA dehydrogenase
LLVRMVDAGWLGRKSGRGFFTYEGQDAKAK